MRDRHSFCRGFLLGLAVITLGLLSLGAVNFRSPNVHYDMKANFPLSVACSADGLKVFVTDNNKVYYSANSGKDWQIILSEKVDGKP
jgi:hypothetical protein